MKNFKEYKELFNSYTTYTAKLLEMRIGEKVSLFISKMSYQIFIILLFGLMILFIAIAAAIYLGQILENMSLGFLSISLFFVITMIIAGIYRKPLIRMVKRKLIIESLPDSITEQYEGKSIETYFNYLSDINTEIQVREKEMSEQLNDLIESNIAHTNTNNENLKLENKSLMELINESILQFSKAIHSSKTLVNDIKEIGDRFTADK